MSVRKNGIFGIHQLDSRKLDCVIGGKIVDVTITSPPYFDLKDYGHENQIGYGQTYEGYLDDLTAVFEKVHAVTKDDGTLWVVINAFRKDGELVPLPFDFSRSIRECGWKLQEIIIWSKNRTVPWTHIGQMRHLFEYILVFSKGTKYKYRIDRIKDYVNLKKWWIKYPERYNPKGKTPEEIWNFDIPTQGSWGNSYIKHFCPLPGALVNRIIQLTTDEQDVVLDPFAGSGAVLAQAAFTKRRYIGFELNREYIRMFREYVNGNVARQRKEYESSQKSHFKQARFEGLIIDLRILKFAKVLRKRLNSGGRGSVKSVYIERLSASPRDEYKIATARCVLLVTRKQQADALLAEAERCMSKPPLSKFGVEARIEIQKDLRVYREKISGRRLYLYTARNTHAFTRQVKRQEVAADMLIVSPIKVQVNEKDFEY